jgi:hypothetical protein
MKGKRGFVDPDTTENEFTKLPFEIGSIAVGQARRRRQPRQRRHQHGVMRKPEQVQRLAPDPWIGKELLRIVAVEPWTIRLDGRS